MVFQTPDFYSAMPEIFVAGMIVLMLLVLSFVKQKAEVGYYLSQLTALVMIALSYVSSVDDASVVNTFNDMYVDDSISDVLKMLTGAVVSAALLYNRSYMRDRKLETMEYYLLVLFAMLGVMVMMSANSLLTVYLGVELLSLASYALVALNRDSAQSTEAAMKYFVLGALSSGMLLYGISMLYGATHTLIIRDLMTNTLEMSASMSMVMIFGLVFVVVGIGFKLGVAPFHMWVPDVYEGAPTPITLLIASAPKLGAFVIAYRVLGIGMINLAEHWQAMLMILAIVSISLGNVVAIAQTNIKRMLAYSGIAHMGFMLLGLASAGRAGSFLSTHAYAASMFYSMTYALTTLAAFGILLLLSRTGFEAEEVADLRGLNRRNSWWAAMMAIVMFSMAGIPFFVGFFSKFFILQATIQAGYMWIAVVAVLMSLVGAFYYLRVVKLIYFDEPLEMVPVGASWGVRTVLSLNVMLIVVLGVFPNGLFQLCSEVVFKSH